MAAEKGKNSAGEGRRAAEPAAPGGARGARKRVAIVGSGAIGSTLAYSLLLRRPGIELLLLNRSEGRAWAKAFDMSHCGPELPGRAIAPSSLEDCADAELIVLAAGVLPRPDGTRTDVIRDNVAILRDIVPRLVERNPGAFFLNVANPVDGIAYAVERIGGLPPGRVLGSGTELDAMRLRSFLAGRFGLEAEALELEVIGEHGETMVPLWSRAAYEGRPLGELLPALDEETKAELLRATRRAGWDIRQAGEHSTYAIAFSAARIVEALLGSPSRPLCVSSRLEGEYGLGGTFLSLPTELGPGGIRRRSPELSPGELAALRASAAALRSQLEEVEALL